MKKLLCFFSCGLCFSFNLFAASPSPSPRPCKVKVKCSDGEHCMNPSAPPDIAWNNYSESPTCGCGSDSVPHDSCSHEILMEGQAWCFYGCPNPPPEPPTPPDNPPDSCQIGETEGNAYDETDSNGQPTGGCVQNICICEGDNCGFQATYVDASACGGGWQSPTPEASPTP